MPKARVINRTPKNLKTVVISSILGGHSPTVFFAAKDQFLTSLGIDPGQSTSYNPIATLVSGILRPTPSTNNGQATLNNSPIWIKSQPKLSGNKIFVHDAQGSAYTSDKVGNLTGLSDGGLESGSGVGNGLEYYDNYMYFARNTTIARYGPLNGSPSFDGDYWGTTLGKAALTNTSYPQGSVSNIRYPNHVLHRHSDGNLYIADVVGNQGTLHYISTKKTTVEGDTDNGSTLNKLQFGFGLWPMAIETYNGGLAIALYEGSNGTAGQLNSKLAFWDGTSQQANQIIWVEFPDGIITALKNVNGILYIASSDGLGGFRISQYVGGYTFQDVAYFEEGDAPFPGGMDGRSNQLVFASNTLVPEVAPCVFSMGLIKGSISVGASGMTSLFNIMRGTSTSGSAAGLCLAFSDLDTPAYLRSVLLGWSTGSVHGLDGQGTDFSAAPSVWWSQMYKVGRPFRITRIGLPLAQPVGANMILTPKFYIDNGATTFVQAPINPTNYPNSDVYANIQVANVMGFNNFYLELRWTGSALMSVGLPIEIEYEIIDLP